MGQIMLTANKLYEETGKFGLKNELNKRMQKRAKKAAAASRTVFTPSLTPRLTAKGPEEANGPPNKPLTTDEPVNQNAMFERGSLADVFKLQPSANILTRFPPEPNGYLYV
ncbi:Glutaminyl-tRNA synthetase [Collariella sp. IMI 366227]|nr:Glutaminyl-tRNA synthetase [Collariella sp. IMI 366227]